MRHAEDSVEPAPSAGGPHPKGPGEEPERPYEASGLVQERRRLEDDGRISMSQDRDTSRTRRKRSRSRNGTSPREHFDEEPSARRRPTSSPLSRKYPKVEKKRPVDRLRGLSRAARTRHGERGEESLKRHRSLRPEPWQRQQCWEDNDERGRVARVLSSNTTRAFVAETRIYSWVRANECGVG